MKRRIPGRRGFTLLELLIVVAIIALLAALLLAAIRGIKGLGLRTQCQSNMRMIGTGFQQYANANRGATSRDLFPYGPPALPPRNPVPTFAPGTGNEVIWRGDLQDAPLGPGKWIGAGLLIRDRYVVAQSDPPDTAEVFWCPAFDITHDIGIDGASGLNQFLRDYAGIRTGTNERVLRTPYLYRTSYNTGITAQGGTPLGPRLLRASQETVSVYADIFVQSLGNFGHGDGYNILYTDKHVWFLDDAAQRLYEGAAIPLADPARQESTTYLGNALGWLAFDQSR